MSADKRQSSGSLPPLDTGAVLVVDDDDATRALICKWMNQADLSTLEAASGEEAIKVVRAAPEAVDAVILDVMMPGLDGYAVLERLQQEEATRTVPVVLLTAHANSDADIVRGVETGAIDHLAKPFSGPVLVAKVRALCERARAERRLRRKLAFAQANATLDALTQLHNRRAFEQRLKQEAAHAKRHRRPLSCAIFDLDHFKSVNDTYGHDAGDRVLVHVADVTRSVLRQEDSAFRFGGEEFVVLLRDTPPQKAALVMQRLQSRLKEQAIDLDGNEKRMTFSCGIAAAEEGNAFDVGDVLQRADEALYRAKRGGRDRVELA